MRTSKAKSASPKKRIRDASRRDGSSRSKLMNPFSLASFKLEVPSFPQQSWAQRQSQPRLKSNGSQWGSLRSVANAASSRTLSSIIGLSGTISSSIVNTMATAGSNPRERLGSGTAHRQFHPTPHESTSITPSMSDQTKATSRTQNWWARLTGQQQQDAAPDHGAPAHLPIEAVYNHRVSQPMHDTQSNSIQMASQGRYVRRSTFGHHYQSSRLFHSTTPSQFGIFGAPPPVVGGEAASSAEISDKGKQHSNQTPSHVQSAETSSLSDGKHMKNIDLSQQTPHVEAGHMGTDKSKLGKAHPAAHSGENTTPVKNITPGDSAGKTREDSGHSTKDAYGSDKNKQTKSINQTTHPDGHLQKVIFDASEHAKQMDIDVKRLRDRRRDESSSGGGGGAGGGLLSALLGMLFFGFSSLLTAGLMSWQLKRRKWKIQLIEDRFNLTNSEPTPITQLFRDTVFRINKTISPSLTNDDDIMKLTEGTFSTPSMHDLAKIALDKHNASRKEEFKQLTGYDVDDLTIDELDAMDDEKKETILRHFDKLFLARDTSAERARKRYEIMQQKVKNPTFYYDTDPLDADNIPDYDVFNAIDFQTVVDSLVALKSQTSFRNVSVDGQFDYDRELFIGPTSPPLDPSGFKKVEMQKGYFVVTPFKLIQPIRINAPLVNPDGEFYYSLPVYIHEVFVNRGWISAAYIRTYIDNPLREHDGKTLESVLKQEQLVKEEVEKTTGSTWGTFLNIFGASIDAFKSTSPSSEAEALMDEVHRADLYDQYGNSIMASTFTQTQFPGINDFNDRVLHSLGLQFDDVYQEDPETGEIYSLLSARTKPLTSPLRRISGILHYGAGLPPDGQFPSTPIRDTDKESYTLLQPAVLSNLNNLAPTTLHLSNGTIISPLSRQKSPEMLLLEASLPMIVIDSTDPNLSKRVRPLESDRAMYLQQDIIRMTMKRRSADDHMKFTTMPETHMAYAVTWGSLSLFSAYLATVMARKPALRQRLLHLWDRKASKKPSAEKPDSSATKKKK